MPDRLSASQPSLFRDISMTAYERKQAERAMRNAEWLADLVVAVIRAPHRLLGRLSRLPRA